MYSPEPIAEFEKYLDTILTDLDIEDEERRELREEWSQHLQDHLQVLLLKGVQREDAIQQAIEQFGDTGTLRQEVTESFPSARKLHLVKELLIWGICILAVMIGPYLLIGAVFKLYFITSPIIVLAVAYPLYHLLVKRYSSKLFALVTVPIAYGILLNIFYGEFRPFTWEHYVTNIFSLDWQVITGNEGFLEFAALHMFWYAVLLWKAIAWMKRVPLWRELGRSSIEYWTVLIVGILLTRAAPSAEIGVITANVMLLYAVLQLVISPAWLSRVRLGTLRDDSGKRPGLWS